jgi:hypothetical protein
MVKRAHDDIDDNGTIDFVKLSKGLLSAVLQHTPDPDEHAALLADLANLAEVSNEAFKKARADLPSFSTVKWSQIAPELKLPPTPSLLGLATFRTPRYLLPPSLHQSIFENAWRWQDACFEKLDREAGLRPLESVCQPRHGAFASY